MSIRSKALAVTAGLALAAAGAVTASGASATTLTCTQTKASFTTPYGCGGLELQYTAKGILDMAADGSYWNAPVRAKTESLTDTSEDWTVFAVGGVTTGGEADLGSYVAMFTPNGVIPGGCGAPGGAYVACGAAGASLTVTPSPSDYCLSVEDVYRTVHGQHVQRWAGVLRPCFADAGGPRQAGAPGVHSRNDQQYDSAGRGQQHCQRREPVPGMVTCGRPVQ